MAKFDCSSCGKTLSVPDKYAGKRVRCPGCQTPQRVPMPDVEAEAEGQPMQLQTPVDLSGLDDNEASGVRRLRQILIGCGECQKTIKVPESKLGKTTVCADCGTVLKVDAFNLSKAKGDLIDMTHLELENADLSLDGGPHGSTLGGSSIQLEGSGGGGYELNTPPSGSMSGVTVGASSQTQMRELRELNDLKYSGQITAEEYRERKKEIYSGKTLAIQAMSRAADGTGGRPVLQRIDKPSLLPKPVILLIVLAILGGGGFAVWSMMSGTQNAPAEVAQAAPSPNAEEATPPTEQAEAAEAVAAAEVEQDEPSETAEQAAASLVPEALGQDPAIGTDTLGGNPDEPVTIFEISSDPAAIGVAAADVPAAAVVPMKVTDWPTGYPVYSVAEGQRRAIDEACELLQRMSVRDDRAVIGVAVGPPAEDFDSPAYVEFRQKMRDILVRTAESDRVIDDLNIRSSERTAELGTLEAHRLHVTSKSNRNVRATVLTGIQDGYCVTYWFSGAKTLYTEFLDTVGRAEIGPAR